MSSTGRRKRKGGGPPDARRPPPTIEKPYIGGARRDLEDLRAAIGHHANEGLHRRNVRVKLPEQGSPRQRWLSRAEVARLLWVCHTHREIQEGVATKKRPLRHLVRFILLGVYTGSRPGVLLTASWERGPGRSWIDVDAGLFYRLPEGARETNKRQPPVPIPPQLLRHLRRWRRRDNAHGFVVRFNDEAINSTKTAMRTAARLAGLGVGVSAYTLRHTAGTWLMERDVSIWMAARYLGRSPEVIEKNYAHHSPSFLREAAQRIGTKGERRTETDRYSRTRQEQA
jgi:integrase